MTHLPEVSALLMQGQSSISNEPGDQSRTYPNYTATLQLQKDTRNRATETNTTCFWSRLLKEAKMFLPRVWGCNYIGSWYRSDAVSDSFKTHLRFSSRGKLHTRQNFSTGCFSVILYASTKTLKWQLMKPVVGSTDVDSEERHLVAFCTPRWAAPVCSCRELLSLSTGPSTHSVLQVREGRS